VGCGSPVRQARSAALAGVALACVASPALAGGGVFPSSTGVVFSPSDANTIALRTTYGILLSHDDGAHWPFLCLDALGKKGGQEASWPTPLTIMASGALVSGAPSGLSVSMDQGCSWSCRQDASGSASIIDLALRPEAPHHVVALSVSYPDADGSAAGMPDTQIFETSDDGASWSPLGVRLPSDAYVSSIAVARSDPSRIYVTALVYGVNGKVPTAWLLVSSDGGDHWVEKEIAPFDPNTEGRVVLGAVDPSDADVVYLRSAATPFGGTMRLLVTRDAGDSFSAPDAVAFTTPDASVVDGRTESLSVALSTDGSKIYVGTRESGLWVGGAGDLLFRQVNPCIDVQCLATRPTARGDELWACSSAYAGGFIAGVSVDEGATFSPRLSLVYNLDGQIACGANTPPSLACGATAEGSTCKDAWQNTICNQAGACPQQGPGYTGVEGACPQDRVAQPGFDADGSVVAGAADGGRPADLVTAKCGCSIPGRKTSAAAACAWLVGVVGWRRRRNQKPCKEANRLR
jgi:hypothetical protein